jgi:hypothetical protein
MKPEGAIGGQMQSNNANRSSAEEKQICEAERLLARKAIPAKRQLGRSRVSSCPDYTRFVHLGA